MTRIRPAHSRIQLNARLILEKDRARARELRRLLLCAAALAAPLLGYVWQKVDFLRVSYRVEELQSSRQEIQALNKQMTVERALLLSPERIEKLARGRLGLIDPHPENVRRVRVIDGRFNAGGPVARTIPWNEGPPRWNEGPRRVLAAGVSLLGGADLQEGRP